MRLSGECVLTKDEEGRWTASLPQFGGVATSARTREEALRGARELLELEAFDLIEEGRAAPRARHVAEVSLITVDVDALDAERSRYVTKAQAAERLGVSRPRVSALVASGQLDVREFGGRELVSLESVGRYRESPRLAGRPAVSAARA